MASTTDILLAITATENVTDAFNNIKNDSSKLKSAMSAVGTGVGLAMASYGKSAVDSAIQAESAWNRFGANINSQGGNWNAQSKEIKSWISTFSNSMGRSVGDTRSAATALMNYGMSWSETKSAMDGIAGLAAKTGSSEEEASNIIISALNGRAQALRKATGLNIADYKAQDGSIDRARLMLDIINSTGQAKSMFADSDEAKMQRMENSLAKLKTTIGQGIVQVFSPLIPVLTSITNAFASMPGPLQGLVGGLFAVVMGASIMSGPLLNMMSLFGSIKGVLGGLASSFKVVGMAEAGLSSVEVGAAAAHASSATSIAAETSANTGLLGSLSAVVGGLSANLGAKVANAAATLGIIEADTAASLANAGFASSVWAVTTALLGSPITWIVIALVALVAVIYKVGEAFGWWDSVGGMLDKIKQALQGVWNALTSIKPETIFNGLKNGVMMMFSPITLVIKAVQMLWNALSSGQARQVFNGIINGIISTVTGFATRLISAGVRGVTGFINRIRQLPSQLWQHLTRGVLRVLVFGNVAFLYMRNAGIRMLNGVLTFIRQLPARIGSFFSNAISRIVSFVSTGASNAMSVGRAILNGLIQFVTQIPNRVYQEFMKIPDRIKSAINGAVNAAKNFGQNVLDAVMNALGIHSPGFIQNNIASEFANIPGRILDSRSNVYNASRLYGQAVLDGFGNPDLSVEGRVNGALGDVPKSLSGMVKVGGSAPVSTGGTTIIHVEAGAFHNSFDARSFTEKECKQMLGNATRNLTIGGA